jgi:hypothetical protein
MHLGQLLEWLGLRSRQIQRRRTMAAGYAPKRFLRAPFRASSESCRYGRYSVNLARFAADADYADPAQSTWEVQRFFRNPLRMWLQIPAMRWSLIRSHSDYG